MGQVSMNEEPVGKLCGRALSVPDLESIRAAVREADPPQRAEIARRVCAALNWVDVQGRPKLMSCRVGLLRLHRAGLIALPAPRNGNGRALQPRCEELPDAVTLSGSVQALAGLRLEAVAGAADSRLWNAVIARWHYLGYTPLSGAQLRDLIRWDGGVLGALGFGAAAWKVAARDRWIGWDAATRERQLGGVLNNARFLILPWVQVNNLASKVLAMAAARVAVDFPARYGASVVLLETFVEQPRFRGTGCHAANWQYLGETAGRGKLDRFARAALPRKGAFAYPLRRDFRAALGVS